MATGASALEVPHTTVFFALDESDRGPILRSIQDHVADLIDWGGLTPEIAVELWNKPIVKIALGDRPWLEHPVKMLAKEAEEEKRRQRGIPLLPTEDWTQEEVRNLRIELLREEAPDVTIADAEAAVDQEEGDAPGQLIDAYRERRRMERRRSQRALFVARNRAGNRRLPNAGGAAHRCARSSRPAPVRQRGSRRGSATRGSPVDDPGGEPPARSWATRALPSSGGCR